MPKTDIDRAPETLTVVLADTHRTRIAIIHEGESLPFQRRTVHITLTDEQRAELAPRLCGKDGHHEAYEEIAGCWLEPVEVSP